MASYIALLRKERASDYSVDFPDFPGCITAGKTLEEARVMAAEALAFHIEGMEGDGEAIPAPSALDTVQLRREHRDAVPFLVTVEPRSAIQRINVTMPSRVLSAIDEYAESIGMNRSAFLAHAATRELAQAPRQRLALHRQGKAKPTKRTRERADA